MERFRFNSFKAEQLVVESLILLGYPENTRLSYYTNDDGMVNYTAEYERYERGKDEKFIMPIKKSEYIKLIKLALEQKGYIVGKLNVCMRNDELSYEAFVDIVVYGSNNKRVRRRK